MCMLLKSSVALLGNLNIERRFNPWMNNRNKIGFCTNSSVVRKI